jgi:hypothetical protein
MGIALLKLNQVRLSDYIVSLLTMRNKIEKRFQFFLSAYFKA